jgi:hypothetical protein
MKTLRENWPFIVAILVVLAISILTSGCAAFPTATSSRVAETVWQTLDAIDTAQTAQFVRKPTCYSESDPFARTMYGGPNPSSSRVVAINVLLMPVHSYVSRWFDDHVNRSEQDDDGNVGAWYTGRIAWHAVSILATGASVANNFSRGATPFGARCGRP